MNWTTRDGRVIPIREMSDSHLTSTILMHRRRAIKAARDIIATFYRKRLFAKLLSLAVLQGLDRARKAMEDEITIIRCDHYDIDKELMKTRSYRALMAEAERRSEQREYAS